MQERWRWLTFATILKASFEDALCLMIAKERGWTCVSNDRRLRFAFGTENVPVLWGFDILMLLVDARALSASAASDMATRIASNNKRIGAEVLSRLLAKIDRKC